MTSPTILSEGPRGLLSLGRDLCLESATGFEPAYYRVATGSLAIRAMPTWSEVRESNSSILLGRQFYHQNFLPRTDIGL